MTVTTHTEQGRELRVLIAQGKNEEAISLINAIGVNTYIDRSVTPFIMACLHQDTVLVEHCLQHGADANALYRPQERSASIIVQMENRANISVLAIACRRANAAIVKLLLEAGANPNYINTQDVSILQEFLTLPYENRNEVLQLLIQHGADVNVKMSHDKSKSFLDVIAQWEIAKDWLTIINNH